MIRSIEHFSFTVSDLDEAVRFFCELLGFSKGAVLEVDDDHVRRVVGMRQAHLRIAFVHAPDGSTVELIEYVEPKGALHDLATCNPGVAHVAIQVEDIDGMYEALVGRGVEFVSRPQWASLPDGGRWAACYLRGPDGISFELIERRP